MCKFICGSNVLIIRDDYGTAEANLLILRVVLLILRVVLSLSYKPIDPQVDERGVRMIVRCGLGLWHTD